MGITVEVPMKGLRIGEQLSWLGNNLPQKVATKQAPRNTSRKTDRKIKPDRVVDLKLFYQLLDRLRNKVSGERRLSDCNGRMDWPDRGIYYLFEPNESRSENGSRSRVVRVGTHALKSGSQTTLWQRLSQHKGTQKSGSGNHRGSIFRLIVGAALKNRDQTIEPKSWGVANDSGAAARKINMDRKALLEAELPLEQAVSEHIGRMPFLWLDISDAPGPDSLRGYIERNSIALLSNFAGEKLDPPSPEWLGNDSDRERVQKSGLWNSNHVDEPYDPSFLDALEKLIDELCAK